MHHVEYLSTNQSTPYEYYVQEGQPTLIECGSYQSSTTVFASVFVFMEPNLFSSSISDNIRYTKDNKLFLQNPTSQNSKTYACQFDSSFGYVRVNVMGKLFLKSTLNTKILGQPDF